MKRILLVTLAALLLAGCALFKSGFNTNQPTKCPQCGWMMELVSSELCHDAKGKYQVVYWRCFSIGCQNWVLVTNYYELNDTNFAPLPAANPARRLALPAMPSPARK